MSNEPDVFMQRMQDELNLAKRQRDQWQGLAEHRSATIDKLIEQRDDAVERAKLLEQERTALLVRIEAELILKGET